MVEFGIVNLGLVMLLRVLLWFVLMQRERKAAIAD